MTPQSIAIAKAVAYFQPELRIRNLDNFEVASIAALRLDAYCKHNKTQRIYYSRGKCRSGVEVPKPDRTKSNSKKKKKATTSGAQVAKRKCRNEKTGRVYSTKGQCRKGIEIKPDTEATLGSQIESRKAKLSALRAKAKGASSDAIAPQHKWQQAFADLADGKNPEALNVTSEQREDAKRFLHGYNKNGKLTGVASKKVAKMKKEAPSLTDEEGAAIGTWISVSNKKWKGELKYTLMNKLMYDPDSIPVEDRKVLDSVNKLAAKGLSKLPPISEQQVSKNAKKLGLSFTPGEPLTRILGNMPPEHAEKYIKALESGKPIREETFFATTHLDSKELDVAENGVNFTFKVEPKWDGKGNGRYVDQFKNGMEEGEIVFLPQTQFAVKSVEQKPDPAAAKFQAMSSGQVQALKLLLKIEQQGFESKISKGKPKSIRMAAGKDWAKIEAAFPDLEPRANYQSFSAAKTIDASSEEILGIERIIKGEVDPKTMTQTVVTLQELPEDESKA